MISLIPDQLIWWVSAVDIPLITSFVITLNRIRNSLEAQLGHMRDHLAAYKLEVAQNYASINHVKDLEARLIGHLLRIENKLDNTAYRNLTKEN